jgi:hypothetical protein
VRPAGHARGRFDVVLGDIGVDGTWRAVVIGEMVLGCRGSGSEQKDKGCVAS